MSDLVCACVLSFAFFSFLTTSHTKETGGAGSSKQDTCKQIQEIIIDRSVADAWAFRFLKRIQIPTGQ